MNVLIALIDPAHVLHEQAHQWFGLHGARAWASCPITQNGVLRVVGHARYPSSPGTPAVVARLMKKFLAHPGHEFWPDSVTLLDGGRVDAGRLLDSAQVTDSYLLALAAEHGGKLATFDRQMFSGAVVEGAKALQVIG